MSNVMPPVLTTNKNNKGTQHHSLPYESGCPQTQKPTNKKIKQQMSKPPQKSVIVSPTQSMALLRLAGWPYAISPRSEHTLLSPTYPNHAQPAHGNSTATPTSYHFFCYTRRRSPPLLVTLRTYSSRMRGACSRWDIGS